MPTSDTVRLTLVRAPGDDTFSAAYQSELRQFFYLVRAEGTKISASGRSADSIGGGGYTGEFFITMMQVIGPAFWRTTLAWMQSHPGRTVLMKIGGAEVAAANANELYGLMDLAIAINQQLTTSYSSDD